MGPGARLTRFERGCVVVLVGAALLRIAFLMEPNFIWDSAWYLMLARSFGETGTFLIRWSDPAAPEYSGYWPPLFPIFASFFVEVFGGTYRTLVLASGVAAALLVAAVFFTTRDLFDRPRAFAAAALVAASPAFYGSDAKGMSESLLGLMVVLTLWAFVRSLTAPRWLPVAAGFAFLAYLGKATLGLPLVAAGVVALGAWRVRTRGWHAVTRSPADVSVAALAALALAALALTRTERIGGLGLGLIEPLRVGVLQADCGQLVAQLVAQPQSFTHVGPHCWALAFPLKILFVCAFLVAVTLPLSLRLPQLLREPRTERTDALWLGVLLPIVAGAVFTTTFFFTERRTFVDFDNIRYLTPAIVPFIWLLLPLARLDEEPAAKDERVRRRHAWLYWSAVGALVALALLNPLTGSETLERFQVLLALSLIPLALAYAALQAGYVVKERRIGRDVELRYAPEPGAGRGAFLVGIAVVLVLALALGAIGRQLLTLAPIVLLATLGALAWGAARGRRRVVMGAGFTLLFLAAWFYSSWYAILALGLAVSLATPSTTRRVIAMSLVLLVSAAPTVVTTTPVEEMARATEGMPAGTVVGMSEIVVYPAAAAPGHLEVRLVDPNHTIPAEVDALVMQSDFAQREYEGFTRVASWDYEFRLFPTVAARLWIERHVLAGDIAFEERAGLTLYVRNGTGLEQHVPR